MTCIDCKYLLPDIDEWVCQNEKSALYGVHVSESDSCKEFEESTQKWSVDDGEKR